jgi:20S proteasome alpha/beta subunit
MIFPKPSRIPPHPKPQRLPRRRGVTLVIGLKAKDSLVIGSESEESVGYLAKREAQKLVRISENDWTVVIGGAGDSATVDNTTEKISDALAGEKDMNGRKVQQAVDDALSIVYTRYIDPDSSHEGISLVVGASFGDELFLLQTQKRVPQVKEDWACAGWGADIAIYWLEHIYYGDFDWERALAAAGFIIRQAKKSARFCSGESQLFVLQVPPNPRWRSPGGDTITDIDWNMVVDVPGLITDELSKKELFSERDEGYADEHKEKP